VDEASAPVSIHPPPPWVALSAGVRRTRNTHPLPAGCSIVLAGT
jgi:hypothetical protein